MYIVHWKYHELIHTYHKKFNGKISKFKSFGFITYCYIQMVTYKNIYFYRFVDKKHNWKYLLVYWVHLLTLVTLTHYHKFHVLFHISVDYTPGLSITQFGQGWALWNSSWGSELHFSVWSSPISYGAHNLFHASNLSKFSLFPINLLILFMS